MKGKVAMVTGGARGIGYGIAEVFASRGSAVVLVDVNAEEVTKSAAALAAKHGVKALGLACDITRRDDVDRMTAEAVKAMGGVDVLVNNAGICPFKEIMEMAPDVWQKTLDVNLTGAFHCTQAVARTMIERGKGGSVVFITSLAAERTNSNQVDYGASKSGLKLAMVGFAAALAKHGIRCNAVAPGMVYTDMTRRWWDQGDNMKNLQKRVPIGRIAYPEDIGKAVYFLASDEASYIVGITIRVDGGHQAVNV